MNCASGPRTPNARSSAVSELDLHRCRKRTTPQGGRIVRTKTIILGAIAALALVTLSANAGNRATPQAQGSLVSLVAATTTVARADRDATTTAAATAIHAEAVEAVPKPVVAARPVPKVTVSAACQDAINTFKALHQADVAEDTAERAAAGQPPSASACRSPTRHARPLSRPCRRSGAMVPTTGASGSCSGRTSAPSTGPPSSPACAPPSAQSPPPAANATNPPLSQGPGRRALFYLDDDAIDLAVAAQDVDGAESLQVQPREAAAQLIMLPADDGGANRPPAC